VYQDAFGGWLCAPHRAPPCKPSISIVHSINPSIWGICTRLRRLVLGGRQPQARGRCTKLSLGQGRALLMVVPPCSSAGPLMALAGRPSAVASVLMTSGYTVAIGPGTHLERSSRRSRQARTPVAGQTLTTDPSHRPCHGPSVPSHGVPHNGDSMIRRRWTVTGRPPARLLGLVLVHHALMFNVTSEREAYDGLEARPARQPPT
jgi:hypothetical protein